MESSPSDSFVESQQCSADPSAFVGYHIPVNSSKAARLPPQETQSSFKLVLDLNAPLTDDSAPIGTNPFDGLFASDTQDDENAAVQTLVQEKNKSKPLTKTKYQQHRPRSPPPTMLKTVEIAWRARRQKIANNNIVVNTIIQDSDLSEDLAPIVYNDGGLNVCEEDEEKQAPKKSIEEYSDQETEYDKEIECTQDLGDEEMTGSYERASVENKGKTKESERLDAETIPFDVMNKAENFELASHEDHATSQVESGIISEYLTPRVNLHCMGQPISVETNQVVGIENEQDDCVPTQPSKSGKNDVSESDQLLVEHNSNFQTKAIQSPEYSFATPQNEIEVSPSHNIEASKLVEETDRPNSSDSMVSSPVATPTPLESATIKCISRPMSGSHTKPTTRKILTPSKPKANKRKRDLFSPHRVVAKSGDPQTPCSRVRKSSRSNPSTPLSTPHVRTRTRSLTPVPTQRAYVSRSRTLFKYKFDFCLTGFVKTGEEALKALIEGHGGNIPDRYENVLHQANKKAIVIATPVSWRKRKFMQAVACGIPILHTDWIKDCIDTGTVIPFDGYQVPIGYSVTTRKFECFCPKELNIFQGYSFGLVTDVSHVSKVEAKNKTDLMAFLLKAWGADAVYENYASKNNEQRVDIILCDEFTPTCRYYKRKHHVYVKNYQWVTECMILQRFIDPTNPGFDPLRVGSDDVFAASAAIGDVDNTILKLHTGELVMVDIAGTAADHFLLFHVCEIVSIHVNGRQEEGSQSKRNEHKEKDIRLRVGLLKRKPYSPELSSNPVQILDVSCSQVKRRVVAISKEDYEKLKYKDESIFYYQDDRKRDETES